MLPIRAAPTNATSKGVRRRRCRIYAKGEAAFVTAASSKRVLFNSEDLCSVVSLFISFMQLVLLCVAVCLIYLPRAARFK